MRDDPMPIRSTYRLQFRNGMDFAAARRLVPYLRELGISHLYASPIMTAVRGSTHGYDVTHANEIDPSLGGLDGLRGLSDDLHAYGLGLILDIVPNHMAAHLENPWWRSVVAWGAESPYARHFDIDWSECLTLPFLGADFEEELGGGTLSLDLAPEDGRLSLRYHDTFYPLYPRSYPLALSGKTTPAVETVLAAAASLRPDDEAANRHTLLAALAAPGVRTALAERLASISRDHGRLSAIHAAQPWKLINWKTAGRHLSYRRFFEIAGLVGLRVEDDGVFADSHRLTLDLVRDGTVDGLRIDHIDGLADPALYLERLRAAIGERPCILIEKILEKKEILPADWPTEGTTGYEFISAVADALVDGERLAPLRQAFLALKPEGERNSYVVERRAAKRQMLTENFMGEVAALTALAKNIADSRQPAFTSETLRTAIEALITALPVYRTYITATTVPESERARVLAVCAKAKQTTDVPETRQAIDFLASLMLDTPFPGTADRQGEFRRRLQQASGPIMAKAVEDTLFYRENALIALNEVGGDPGAPIAGVAGFHAAMKSRAESMPKALSATSTHDTKRGEDARARLYALSEAPEIWIAATRRWQALNDPLHRSHAGTHLPAREVEWLLYQSLAGIWSPGVQSDPVMLEKLRERLTLYATKALREAKRASSWTAPRNDYEQAIADFIEGCFANEGFLEDFDKTLSPFIDAGLVNALAQTMIKLTAPGIPDIYQGSECGDFSLVDPDNRTPLDPAGMPQLEGLPGCERHDFPRYKQWVIGRVLATRRDFPVPFEGPYLPLEITGGEGRAIAFLRGTRTAFTITIVPRLVFAKVKPSALLLRETALPDATITLPPGWKGRPLHSILDGKAITAGNELTLSDLLAEAPVALLRSAAE